MVICDYSLFYIVKCPFLFDSNNFKMNGLMLKNGNERFANAFYYPIK